MNVTLNKNQKKYLRSLAHERKPIIWIGQKGLTDNLLKEINIALEHHELIKIKIRAGNRERRDQLIDEICNKTHAELVQKIGNIIVIFRKNINDPSIVIACTGC